MENLLYVNQINQLPLPYSKRESNQSTPPSLQYLVHENTTQKSCQDPRKKSAKYGTWYCTSVRVLQIIFLFFMKKKATHGMV